MCSHSLKRMDTTNCYRRGDLTDIVRAGTANDDSPAEWQQFPTVAPVTFSADDFGDPFAHFGDPLLQPVMSSAGLFEAVTRRPNFVSAAAADQISRAKSPPLTSSSVPSHRVDRPLQISSPRNTGIRRRKSQAKKVVCVPAPAPANSRSSGEIVPSDLWAWRKYGQKPIKGSPYPRGYYRCSSSKGCPARKQVERSRTDPNMLVITYTSEHNHPWPTQRNALAGSTRSQPSKAHKSPSNPDSAKIAVKEEYAGPDFETPLGTDGVDLDEGLKYTSSYRPILLPGTIESEDNFFADLGEIEADSLSVFGFSGGKGRRDEGLDPLSFYEWAYGDRSG